ncbi:DNA-binding transcriptional regulator, MarR family [Pseudomonas cuatrocienegasensis]|uniref:DNA-binding transcriptional regulator, MarR family n=1 Tax=Pseudomonas cuatrocienegasensis TaxID=543360 RepID=A0ABY1BMM7_9PSED|nr:MULTISPECIES: MarR family transcriptional regulator [Pseudomonas]OEC34446.1 MarR family transcriptional regulator [Pseudomonas sp. 21C1]SER19724.1 DNA-binding transcriptional regulator, MarR family [Pseudomonas cuatrocienegasensis]
MAKPALPAVEPDANELDSALDTYLGYVLRRAQLKVFQHLSNQLEAYDLRPAQFTALAIIDQHPGLMQADLARALAIEPPQAVVLVNKLEQLGLAARVRCKPDKRSYGLFLSKVGETRLKELKAIAADSDRDATAGLDASEREQLLVLLRKLYRGA